MCASCHAETRLGGKGPALIPESLGRLKGDKLAAVITEGRAMTQMPGFKDTLSPQEIAAVAAFVATPLEAPVWGEAEIGLLPEARNQGLPLSKTRRSDHVERRNHDASFKFGLVFKASRGKRTASEAAAADVIHPTMIHQMPEPNTQPPDQPAPGQPEAPSGCA